ncbi:SDR family oxidoreductase, partial [Rhizobium ruizarguesonis]
QKAGGARARRWKCRAPVSSEGRDRMRRAVVSAPADWLEKAAASQPFGRLVDQHEVARACAYLSSSESGLMTGSVICFDQS